MTLVMIRKQLSIGSFKISAGISPSLELFLLLWIKIFRLISSNETELKVN